MAGFLKIGDIKGQAEDAEHKDWIELLSVGQLLRRPMTSGSGGQASRQQSAVECPPVQVTKQLDKSTPKLAEAVCDGKTFPEVEVHLCTSEGASGRKPYYKIKMKNVKVTDHSLNASAQAGMGDTESMALNYTEIEWTYTSFGSDGKAQGDTKATFKVGPGTS
jgi:type VI secretion system secreted protein Hcp